MATFTVTKTKIRSGDFSDAVNPTTRWNNLMPSMVYSGGLPPVSTSLVSIITACVAYVEGVRVSVAATTKTFTANKDTYVDLDTDGSYQYSEVANGGAEPTWADNSIRMCKVVTGATTVSSVVDFRANNAAFGMGAPVGV